MTAENVKHLAELDPIFLGYIRKTDEPVFRLDRIQIMEECRDLIWYFWLIESRNQDKITDLGVIW